MKGEIARREFGDFVGVHLDSISTRPSQSEPQRMAIEVTRLFLIPHLPAENAGRYGAPRSRMVQEKTQVPTAVAAATSGRNDNFIFALSCSQVSYANLGHPAVDQALRRRQRRDKRRCKLTRRESNLSPSPKLTAGGPFKPYFGLSGEGLRPKLAVWLGDCGDFRNPRIALEVTRLFLIPHLPAENAGRYGAPGFLARR